MTERLIPHDIALPALSSLFPPDGAPGYVTDALHERVPGIGTMRAEVSYVRYWPGKRCVVQWTFRNGAGDETIVSGEMRSKEDSRHEKDERHVIVADKRLTLQIFPHDDVLEGMDVAFSEEWQRTRLAPTLGGAVDPGSIRATATSYKSWRRCVAVYDYFDGLEELRAYGKIFRDDRGEALHNQLKAFEQALDGSELGWRIPRTLAYFPEAKLLLQGELSEATSLSELGRRAPEDESIKTRFLDAVEAVAQGLPRLQGIRIEGLPVTTHEDVLASLEDDVESIASVSPRTGELLARQLRRLRKTARRATPEALVLSHGALRHSHVYDTPTGLALLDLDALGMAGANADAGYFLAYLAFAQAGRPRLRAVLAEAESRFLDAWRRSPTHDPAWRSFYTQAVLLKWAVRAFFSLDDDWPLVVQATAEAAASRARTARHERAGGTPGADGVDAGWQRVEGIVRDAVPRFWPNASLTAVRNIEMAYEPGEATTALATISLKGDGPRRGVITVSFGATDEAALQQEARRFASKSGEYVVETFPADYRLPGLARVVDATYVAHLAGLSQEGARLEAKVLRYRPHERCVVRLELKTNDGEQRYVAKVYDREHTARDVWQAMTRLREQLSRPDLVVAPVAFEASDHLILMEYARGDSLGERLDAGKSSRKATALIELAAQTLAHLHAGDIELPDLRTYETESTKLRAHARDIHAAGAQELGRAIDEALDEIDLRAVGVPEPDASVVHGGFKPTQLIVGDDGVTVLDFDDACLGDPAMDVGRFMAKLRADAIVEEREHLAGLDAKFLEAYLAATTRDVTPERARRYEALALVRMASRRFHTTLGTYLRDGSLGGYGKLLAEAHNVLDAG